jgi:hypothetical protein
VLPDPPQFGDPLTEEQMLLPGASTSNQDAAFEKFDSTSLFVVLPTVMADEMQPGALVESDQPSFPDAMTVAMPTPRSLSTTGFVTWLSQVLKFRPPPMLMFAAAMA